MLNWDKEARRYVEGGDVAVETFGPLEDYGASRAAGADGDTPISLSPPSPGRAVMHGLAPRAFGTVIRQVVQTGNSMASGAANDNTTQDRGPHVGTYTGRFYPFDPRPEDVRIVDIAHSLAGTSRYAGAGYRWYSTAEHSVHIARWLIRKCQPPHVVLAGLLHDAPEAVSGFSDVLRPVKDRAPIIRETEENIWRRAIAPAFGLDADLPGIVHEADSRIIVDEMGQNSHEIDPDYTDQLGIMLEYWPPETAELYFLDAFRKIQNMRAAA